MRLHLFPTLRRPVEQPNPQQARQELAEDVKRLEETRAETPKYVALGRSLREIRERNHLGEAIAHTFRGGKP